MSSIAKLTRPRLTRVHPRRRLFLRIDAALRQHRAVWIAGAPGAGKTTLAASYLDERGLRGLWYQVDRGDDDLATFFHYLACAGEEASRGGRGRLPRFAPEHAGDPLTFARRLFRELGARVPAPFAFVFDDCHEVGPRSAVHAVLRAGLREIGEGRHVLLLSRSARPPGLAGAAANGELAAVAPDELKLGPEEARGVARAKVGRGVRAREVVVVNRELDGWAAGLVLALARRSAPRPPAAEVVDRAALFEYFAAEVLARAEDDTRRVLLETAILPRATAAMAQALTGIARAGAILERLADAAYFTVRDVGSEPSFRYHPLFREFLLNHGRALLDPAHLRRTRISAASLLVARGEVEDAVALLVEAQAWPELAPIVLAHAPALVRSGRYALVARWIDAIPGEVRGGEPWLAYWSGVARFPFAPREARAAVEAAHAGFDARGDSVGLYTSWSFLVSAVIYDWADMSPLDGWIARFAELRRRHPVFPSPDIERRAVAAMFIAMLYRQPDHPELDHWLGEAERVLVSDADLALRLEVGHALVQHGFWTARLARSRAAVEVLRPIAAQAGVSPLVALGWFAMYSAYGWVAGDPAECVRVAEEGLALAAATGVHFLDGVLCQQALWGCLLLEDFARGERYVARMERHYDASLSMRAAHHHHVRSAFALRRGDLLVAVEEGRRSVEFAERTGTQTALAFTCLGAGAALLAQGRDREGEEALARAEAAGRRMRSGYTAFGALILRARRALARGGPGDAVPLVREAMAIGADFGYVSMPWVGRAELADLCALAIDRDLTPEHAREIVRTAGLPAGRPAAALEAWPWPVRVRTLGHFALARGGEEVVATSEAERRALDVLQALVALGGADVVEADVAAALRAAGRPAGRSLRQACAALERLLGPGALRAERGTLTLDRSRCWVDALGLQERLREVSLAWAAPPHAERAADAVRIAERAAGIARGRFLPGERAPWAEGVRRKLLGLAAGALARVRAAGGAAEAERALERCVAAMSSPAAGGGGPAAGPSPDASSRAVAAAARWTLTRRQAEVLERVVRGDSNKAIAAALGCAESTIELHVTALLRKAACANRAALVARFWTDA